MQNLFKPLIISEILKSSKLVKPYLNLDLLTNSYSLPQNSIVLLSTILKNPLKSKTLKTLEPSKLPGPMHTKNNN
jgi:hypothetical protein